MGSARKSMRQISRFTFAFLAIMAFAACDGGSGGGESSSDGLPASSIIDGHAHINALSGSDYSTGAQTVVSAMDAAGVAMALLMSPPQAAGTSEGNVYSELLNAAGAHPGRFYVLGGGSNLNLMIHDAYAAGSVSASLRSRFESTARRIIADGAIGFGEMASLHVSLRSGHPYLYAPADHELFLLLADIAAELNVPIDLHAEAVVNGGTPRQSWVQDPTPATLPSTISSLENLLSHNREAKIIWAHVGWDNVGDRTASLCRDLMSRHSNLYMSVKIRSSQTYKPNIPVSAGGALSDEWKSFFTDYADRIFLGSDEKHEPGSILTGNLTVLTGLLSQLSSDAAEKIAYTTFKSVYNLQ